MFFKLFQVRLGLHKVLIIAGVYISKEMFANGILTALKPSLEHDHKPVLQLLRLYGDQALMYSNCKLVNSRRYAAFLVKNNTPLSPEQAGPYVEASERKLRDVGFFLNLFQIKGENNFLSSCFRFHSELFPKFIF